MRAPIIETTIESTQPLQLILHHNVVVQNPGSAIAERINAKLQIRGTYQMLLVFPLTMKKQHVIVTKSYMI
jgi:hypothetical protein